MLEVVADDRADKPAFELSFEELRAAIAKIDPDNPARGLLLSLVDRADSRLDQFQRRIAGWFDAAMDRVAGWYKRQATYFLLAVAATVTIAVNADTIRIAELLWQDHALRSAIAAGAVEAAAAEDLSRFRERTHLTAFPIGYPASFPGITARTLVGWLLTIAAISLGAPFWFDLLGKIVHLRASGSKRAAADRDK